MFNLKANINNIKISKNVSLILIVLGLTFVSGFVSNESNQGDVVKENLVDIDRLMGSGSDIIEIDKLDMINNDFVQDVEIKESISSDWQEGETVEVIQTFPDRTHTSDFGTDLDIVTVSTNDTVVTSGLTMYETLHGASTWWTNPNAPQEYTDADPWKFLQDDMENSTPSDADVETNSYGGSMTPISSTAISSSHYVEQYLNFTINDISVAYDIEFHSYGIINDAPGWVRFPGSPEGDDNAFAGDLETTVQTNSSMIFNDEINIKLRVWFDGKYDGGDEIMMINQIFYWDPSDGWTEIGTSNTGWYAVNGYNTPAKVEIYFEYLSVVPVSILEHVRTQRYAVSYTSVIHEFDVFVPLVYGTVTMKVPVDWEFSSLSPNMDVTESGNDFSFDALYGLATYTIKYVSNSPKQYLAISQYKSYDFEGSGGDNLNSTIVSSGAFSERKTSGNLNFEDDDLPEGYYYADVDCYIETAPTAVVLQYYDGSSWINATSASVSATDRWQQLFAYLHPTGVSSGYTIRVVIDGSGIVFYDDINFNTVNHKVETSGYRRIKVSGQTINWDQYSCNGVSYEDIEVAAYDRTAGTEITSTTVTTDINGYWEWIIDTSSYSALQDQREIEVRSYSWDSWWGTESTWVDELTDTTKWSAIADIGGGSVAVDDDAIKLEVSDDNDANYIMFNWSFTKDFTEIDAVYFESKANKTLSFSSSWQITFYDIGSNTIYRLDQSSTSITTSYSSFYFKIPTDQTGLVESGLPNGYFSYQYITSSNYSIWIKNYRTIQAQKSYFTPLISTDFPFYYETSPSNNEFDFSEETDDSATYYQCSDSQENGYNLINPSSATVTKFYIQFHNIGSIDASEYTRLILRVKTNVSDLVVRPEDQFSNTIGDYEYLAINTWHICDWDIGADEDWSGTETGFFFYFDENGGDGQPEANNFVWIDIARLASRDTPAISTADSYAWVSSSNNSLAYRIEQDSSLLGYETDLNPFWLNMSLGSHEINATPFVDLDRLHCVFLPGESITASYEVVEADWHFTDLQYDDSGFFVQFYFQTTWNNLTAYIYENSSLMGSTGENIAFSYAKDLTYGAIFNVTIVIDDVTLEFWYQNAQAPVLDYWDFTTLYFDVSDFFVQFGFETSWNNLTAYIYENSSLMGSTGENSIFSYDRNLNYNVSRNVTVVIENVTLQYFYSNAPEAEQETVYFDVWFDFIDGVGLGLDWETFKLNINDSRQYSQALTVENGTLLVLEVLDYFNTSLLQENHTINETGDIALIVDVFQVIFRNNNTEFDAELILERNGHMLNLTVSKGESVIHRFTEGEYEITSYYIVPNSLYGVAGEEFTEGKHLSLNEKITFSKVLGEIEGDQIVDIGGPKPTIPFMEYIKRNYVTWGFIYGMIITTFATIIIRELWNMVKSEALGRAPADSLITSEKTEQKQTLLDEKQKRKHLRKDYE